MNHDTKLCPRCKQEKSIQEFYKNTSTKDGYHTYCKPCQKQHYRQWRLNNPDYQKEWYQNDQPLRIEKARIKRQQNREKYNENARRWYNKQPKTFQQWGTVHKLERNKQLQQKRKNNPNYKLLCNLRHRSGIALKNNQKSGHTLDLLMCTVEFWRKHLESLWTKGMSWNNYGNKAGQWSIDHIIPCDFFKDYLDDPIEQYMCFRWQNTQPMWHVDNIRKNAKITFVSYK